MNSRIALLVATALAAVAAVLATPAGAAGTAPTKTGTDVSVGSPDQGSTTTTQRGDTVQWDLAQLDGGAAAGQVTVTDPIPAGQAYVPGSLQVPPGWTGSVSNGRVSASGSIDATHQTGSPAAVPAPQFNATTTDGGGDGYAPIPYGTNIYVIHHHSPLTNPGPVDCFSKITGVECPGFPKSITTPAVYGGAGSTATILVTYLNQATGQLYLPVTYGTGDAGIACLQLPAMTPCAAGGSAILNVGGIVGSANGLVKIGTKLWTFVRDQQNPRGLLACVDLDAAGAMTPCPAQTLVAGGSIFSELTSTNGAPAANQTSPSATPGHFPFSGEAVVAGSTQIAAVTGSTPLIWLDAAGNSLGFCYHRYLPETDVCVRGDTGAQSPAPAALTAITSAYPGVGDDYTFGYSPLVVGTREYIPVWNFGSQEVVGIKDSIVCFDWATGAACPNFGNTSTPGYLDTSSINGGHQHTYGLAVDDQNPGCGWAYGDARQLFNFQLVQGADCGAGQTSASTTLDSASFYCGVAPTGHHWSTVTLTGIPADEVYTSSVTVFDASDTPVPGFIGVPLAADGTLDISSIPTSGTTSKLTARLDATVATAPFQNGAPTLTISFDGPTGSVCFRATNSSSCLELLPVGVTNTAHVVVAAAGSTTSFDPRAHLAIDPSDPTNGSCPTPSASSSPPAPTSPGTTTLRPPGSGSNQALATTGTPAGLLLVLAGSLVSAGAAALFFARRGKASHARG
jgi:uncharacterized repeat protein (TIGR01451 family)